MSDVKVVNNGEVKRTAPGHTGIRGGEDQGLTASEASVYVERWGHLFESGELEATSLDGETLEPVFDESLGRYTFLSGDEAPEEDEDEYELDDVNASDLRPAIADGDHDDRLDEIIENEDRSTVIETAEARRDEIADE